jgi:hypothetical protein
MKMFNLRLESNRRHFSAPLLLQQIGRAFCAPPILFPAVAHSKHSLSQHAP